MGESKRRRRIIWFLVSLVVLLAGCNLFMIIQSGIAGQVLRGTWNAVTRAEGIRVLLSQLDLGATSEEAAVEWTQRGAELVDEGQFQEAVLAFEKAVALAPEQAVPHMGLARAYEALDERERALAHLEDAAELDPGNAEVQRHLGRLRCLTGEYDACVATLEKAVELEPAHPLGHFLLAMAYQGGAEDGYSKAEVEYREVLKLDPEFGGAHLGLGYLYQSRPGKEYLAIEEFKKALDAAAEADDESLAAQARSELASLYFAKDNFSKCIDELKQVLAQDPDDTAAHRRIGLCYAMRGGAGDLEQAVAELEHALARDFSDVDLYYLYLGEHLAAEGDVAGAVGSWEQFLRFSNDDDMKAQVKKKIERLSE